MNSGEYCFSNGGLFSGAFSGPLLDWGIFGLNQDWGHFRAHSGNGAFSGSIKIGGIFGPTLGMGHFRAQSRLGAFSGPFEDWDIFVSIKDGGIFGPTRGWAFWAVFFDIVFCGRRVLFGLF